MRLKSLLILLCVSLLAAGPLLAQEIRFLQRDGGYLGVELRNVDADDAASLSLQRVAGVVIERVEPGTPAEEAGLQPGDAILEYAGVTVLSVRHLQRLVSETPPGREIDLSVNRGGRQQQIMVQVGKRQSSVIRPRDLDDLHFDFDWDNLERFRVEPGEGRSHIFVMSSRPRLGVSVITLTEQLADFLEVPDSQGLLVTEVVADSPAARAGLQAGDVIVELNGDEVGQPHRLSLRLKAGQNNDLRVYRRGRAMSFTIEIEEPSPPKGGKRRL
ncbi:MAG TPA: PDZ domain-containing protein [Acidobacteriota bacterium]|nr:PDZ domain-containing protein [Acidobacteriota bacterium]